MRGCFEYVTDSEGSFDDIDKMQYAEVVSIYASMTCISSHSVGILAEFARKLAGSFNKSADRGHWHDTSFV